jgi:hypothetical protein
MLPFLSLHPRCPTWRPFECFVAGTLVRRTSAMAGEREREIAAANYGLVLSQLPASALSVRRPVSLLSSWRGTLPTAVSEFSFMIPPGVNARTRSPNMRVRFFCSLGKDSNRFRLDSRSNDSPKQLKRLAQKQRRLFPRNFF